MNLNNIPFVEKYRPVKLDEIVLDPLNKVLMNNIIETGYFPNLLFYGPPGSGKTTSIINLINAYQIKWYKQQTKELIIHLNASDDRGIDIIRSQINQFVNSNSLFNNGIKFVILDEVDYCTKNAQQALRYLLQHYSNNVRFCLICNYISRVEEILQNEFLRLRFNQLPEEDIINFLSSISSKESLNINKDSLIAIQKLYKSDIRSMINFIQSNQDIINSQFYIIDNNIWQNLYDKINNKENVTILNNIIQDISIKYNIDKKNIIKSFLNYIIRNKSEFISIKFLNFVENIMHYQDCKNSHYIYYTLSTLSTFSIL
jgi:replication factor C subunit 3/5